MEEVKEPTTEEVIEIPQKIQTGYHYACVIKDGKYHEFVIVNEFDDDTEEVYAYTLQEGESLIDAKPPVKKIHAESDGFIVPAWNGSEWVEGATDEEIAQFEAENPAPEPPGPTDNELQWQAITDLEIAQMEYEQALTDLEIAQLEG